MLRKKAMGMALACGCLFTGIQGAVPVPAAAQTKATVYHYTYNLPANLEKYLILHPGMVEIQNPHPQTVLEKNQYNGYLFDRNGGYISEKTMYMETVNVDTSKMGFLLNLYHWIGILPPVFPEGFDAAELDRQIKAEEEKQNQSHAYNEKWSELLRKRAQINLQARLQALIDAGCVLPEEIDDGPATRQFVATVLYRMYKDVRPYKGSVKLLDTQDQALHWAVETGLPGFEIDSKGNVFPDSYLSLAPGPKTHPETYAYSRLFDFLTLIMPGKKTATGWEYYQVQLRPQMVPVRTADFIYVNGQPLVKMAETNRELYNKAGYYSVHKQIMAQVTSRFPQMLQMARQDTMKPRLWDWRRDLVTNPKFSDQVAAYRKTKSSQALNAVYQAVRKEYNLYLRQDSPAVIKSVLDHIK